MRINLFDYYGIEDHYIDKLLKYFYGDIQFEPNEFGFIYTKKNPPRSFSF